MLSAPCRRPRARGFSSMEVLAGLGVTLILLAAVYTFQQAQTKAFLTQQVYSDSQNVTRSMIDLMARELRMACYDPGTAIPKSIGPCAPDAKQGIIEATPTKIHFRQDLNGDNANPPGQIVPGGSPAALNQCQRDSVAKVRVTVRANLPNPNPRISTPIASIAESEVAVRNRSLVNF